MFSGSIVALITPFRDNRIDEAALRKLVNWHIDQGSHGLVPVGTTGESPTLSAEEHNRVVEIVVEECAGRIPVIAGAGSNNTAEAIAFTQHAEHCGVDATLHVTGYYNRPSQQGIIQHFTALDAAANKPIITYNIPPRTNNLIELGTMVALAKLPNIVGVKDATGDLARPLRERAAIGADFCMLSGEDATAVAYNASGGQGCISVTANVLPTLSARMQAACNRGDFATAMRLQQRLLPLHDALFREPSPAGIKFACAELGLCTPDCRLPIVELSAATKTEIRQLLDDLLE